MAGDRQHYIPRFLIRGFLSRKYKKKEFTWYFRKEARPREESIKNIAVSTRFYGKSIKGSLDDTITKNEGDVASVINKMRRLKKVEVEDRSQIADFVTMLIVRTKFIRTGFGDGHKDLLEMARKNLLNPDNVKNLFLDDINSKNSSFEKQLRVKFKEKFGVSNSYLEDELLSFSRKNKKALSESIARPASQVLVSAIDKIKKNHKRIVSEAHNDALEKIIRQNAIEEKENRFNKLYWTVNSFQPDTLILGDIGALIFDITNRKFVFPFLSPSTEYAVLIPIAHDCILVGTTSKISFQFDPEKLNLNTAEFSSNFLVSKSFETGAIHKNKISKKSSLLDKALLDKLEQKTFIMGENNG